MTSSGQFTSYRVGPNSDGMIPIAGYAITTGPDGNPWVLATGLKTGKSSNSIVRINPSGKITSFPVSLAADRFLGTISAGPGQGLSFTVTDNNEDVGPNPQPTLGRVAPDGHVTFTALPRKSSPGIGKYWIIPTALATGSDGNLWLAVNSDYSTPSGSAIFRMNTAGRHAPGPAIRSSRSGR